MSKLIYVNAGHGAGITGAYDPGAVGPTGLKEADITQDIADRLEHLLRAAGLSTDGKKVESFLEAVNAANAAKADLLISLHCNSIGNRQAHGTEVFYCKPGSKKLAGLINAKIMAYIAGPLGALLPPQSGFANRGVKQGSFAVIRKATMPAALVEVAFISNPAEEKLLASRLFRQEVAAAICEAILEYLK
jgi:N-acetylmuramoyl-L-alanine amidase